MESLLKPAFRTLLKDTGLHGIALETFVIEYEGKFAIASDVLNEVWQLGERTLIARAIAQKDDAPIVFDSRPEATSWAEGFHQGMTMRAIDEFINTPEQHGTADSPGHGRTV